MSKHKVGAVSSNGPVAAIVAMEQEVIVRHFAGESNDPAQVIGNLEEQALEESFNGHLYVENDISETVSLGCGCHDPGSDRETSDIYVRLAEDCYWEKLAHDSSNPFFHHQEHHLPKNLNHLRSEALAISYGRGITKGDISHCKHPQYHDGFRIHGRTPATQ